MTGVQTCALPILIGTDEYVIVATTRPETMLGDTAVCINPRDERYKKFHGKSVRLPLMNREIPFILDELADPEFGTGVVKVTPAHDANDFQAGLRHNLPQIDVMDETGRMNKNAGPYADLDRFEGILRDAERDSRCARELAHARFAAFVEPGRQRRREAEELIGPDAALG